MAIHIEELERIVTAAQKLAHKHPWGPNEGGSDEQDARFFLTTLSVFCDKMSKQLQFEAVLGVPDEAA